MSGTLIISTPATDSASGYSSTSIPITWTFTGTPSSTTQAQRRITLQPTGTSALSFDSGYAATSSNNFTLTGLSSGLSYDCYVYVLDSAGATTSTKRVVITSYARSLPSTIVFGADSTESITVQCLSPSSSGSRPTVISNAVYYRLTGSTGAWTYAGTTGLNGTLAIFGLRPMTSYDFFCRTDTGADSITYTATTPFTSGLWMYDPLDLTTRKHFPWGAAGAETLGYDETPLTLIGRTYPLVEAGIQETQTVQLAAVIPFSESDWQAQVEWWRTRKRARTTLIIRDGRGHAYAGRLTGDLTVTPNTSGATVSSSFLRIDYTQSTVTIAANAYSQGSTNDGGNGVYGNGVQGNGY